MKRLRHGGLFEGYGGTTMAAALTLGPLETRWVSDTKPAAIALLRHHDPDAPNLGDMTAIDWAAVDPIDLLTASWPCQPHSSAGKRLGEADPRALWPYVARAIEATRPAIFLGENVARITSNGELRRVVRSLADLGYVGAWRVLNASDVKAPHKRARCFVAAVDPAAHGISGGLAQHPQRDGGAHPGQDGALRLDAVRPGARGQAGLTLLPTPKASDGPKGGPGMRGSSGDIAMPSAAVLMEGRRWGVYAPAIHQWEAAFGRPAPAPTVTSPRTGKPQLSPRFVEWMMGLPEGHVCDVPGLAPRPAGERNAMLSLLGDGVVPQQGAAAFRFLLEHLVERLAVAA